MLLAVVRWRLSPPGTDMVTSPVPSESSHVKNLFSAVCRCARGLRRHAARERWGSVPTSPRGRATGPASRPPATVPATEPDPSGKPSTARLVPKWYMWELSWRRQFLPRKQLPATAPIAATSSGAPPGTHDLQLSKVSQGQTVSCSLHAVQPTPQIAESQLLLCGRDRRQTCT